MVSKTNFTERHSPFIVASVNPGDFVRFDFQIFARPGISVAEAAIRSLLIVTRRSVFEGKDIFSDYNPLKYGAVVNSPGLRTGGHSGKVTIAIPRKFFPDDDPFTTAILLSASVAEYSYVADVWLEDIAFPEGMISENHGPRIGAQGIRNFVGVYDRPLLAAVLPSSHRVSNAEMVDFAAEAVSGGVDLLVDDILSPPLSERDLERWEMVQNVVKNVSRNQRPYSSKVGFVANTSVGGKIQLEALKKCKELNIFGICTNTFLLSYSNISNIRDFLGEDYCPAIFSTNMGSSMLGRNPIDESQYDGAEAKELHTDRTGISETVTARLSRFAGCDAVHTGTTGAECWHPAALNLTPKTLTDELPNVKQSMCVAEGDLRLAEIGENVQFLGDETILEVSSGMLESTNVQQAARAYLEVTRLVDKQMSKREYEAMLFHLSDRDRNVKAVLEQEGWTPTEVAPDDNPKAILQNATWINPEKKNEILSK